MRKTALVIGLAGLFAVPFSASAQVTAGIQVNLPVVLPQLVVVSPGIEVVPDVEYEVFHSGGWYWVREDGGWYRSRNYRGGWVAVPSRGVPPGLMRIPPGQYKKWHPAGRAPGRYAGPGRAGPGFKPARHAGPAFRPGGHGGDGWKHGGGGGHKGGGKHGWRD
ncbi:MAG TPA: hypothetical protein VLT61_14675 [Anaeromyxobacteraceae bacterium]|nr:hypothetical protein [Anaeromyxobacteraceae bacterium]